MLFRKSNKSNYIDGDLLDLALKGKFDAIAHGLNCFNTQKSGIAKQMVEVFKTNMYSDSFYPMEAPRMKGDIQKLGNIEWCDFSIVKYPDGSLKIINTQVEDIQYYVDNHFNFQNPNLSVINCYTQYEYGTDKINVDYTAIEMCMKKINHIFKGKRIGLPKIGAGLAGGDWNVIEDIIVNTLKDVQDYKIVIYKP